MLVHFLYHKLSAINGKRSAVDFFLKSYLPDPGSSIKVGVVAKLKSPVHCHSVFITGFLTMLNILVKNPGDFSFQLLTDCFCLLCIEYSVVIVFIIQPGKNCIL